MRTWIAATLALALLAAAAPAQDAEPGDLDHSFYRAFYAENGLRDFAKAAKSYGEVAAAAEKSGRKDLRSKALVGQARCLRTAGQTDAATVVIAALLRHDPENAEARELQAALAGGPAAEGADENLTMRCRILMQNLHDASVWREFRLLGEQALPFLVEGLRARDLGTVEACAAILATGEIPGGRDALLAALSDRGVAYPRALCETALSLPSIDMSVGSRALSREELPLFAAIARRPEADLRRAVAGRLAESALGEEEAAAALLRALSADPSPEVRRFVLGKGWSDSFDPVRGPLLLDAVRSPSAAERALAIFALVAFPDLVRREGERLRALLQDGDEGVRVAAFQTFAQTEGLDQEQLAALLSDANSRNVASAASLLANATEWRPATLQAVRGFLRRAMGGEVAAGSLEPILELVAAHPGSATSLTPADLVDLYVATWAPACRLGPGDRTAVRERLLEQAWERIANDTSSPQGEARGHALVESGIDRLTDPDALVAWLTTWGPQGHGFYAAPTGLKAGASADPRVRRLAYEALRSLAGPPLDRALAGRPLSGALPRLVGDVASEDREVAAAALGLAMSHPDPALAPALRTLRANPPEGIGGDLLVALVNCAGAAAEPDVREALQGADDGLRSTALGCLFHMLGVGKIEDIEAFLARRGEPRAVAALFRGSRRPPDDVLRAFLAGLPAERLGHECLDLARVLTEKERKDLLLRALRSGAPATRRSAVALVSAWHVIDFAEEVANLLDDMDPSVREAAKKCLEEIRAYIELKASAARIRDGGASATFLTAEEMLKDPDPLKRRGGVLALAALGDKAAIPILLRVLDDKDPEVRAAAIQALERMGGR